MGGEHLDPALAPVEEHIEIPRHLAEIVAQWRRLRVEGGEDQSAVAVELRHRDEAPLRPVELVVIKILEMRDAGQRPVVAIGPAVIGAGKARGIAAVGAAQAIAAMAADIQKGVDLAVAVAHHQHRVLAHIGRVEIAGLGDLALVAQEQPAAGEDLLLLLLVDLRLDKDAAADEPVVAVDQPFEIADHRCPPSDTGSPRASRFTGGFTSLCPVAGLDPATHLLLLVDHDSFGRVDARI